MSDRRLYSWFDLASLAVVAGMLAIGLRAAAVLPISHDEGIYLQLTRTVERTGSPIRDMGSGQVFLNSPPLCFYINAAADRALPGSLEQGDFCPVRRFHLLLWGTAACVAVWWLGRQFGPAGGLTAVLALATQQTWIAKSSVFELDIPLAALSSWLLVAVFEVERSLKGRRRTFWIAAACIFSAACCWTKYQGFLTPFWGVSFLNSSRWLSRSGNAERHAIWPAALAIVACSALAVAAWVALSIAAGADWTGTLAFNLGRMSLQAEGTQQPTRFEFLEQLVQLFAAVLIPGTLVTLVSVRRMARDARYLLLGGWIVLTLAFVFATSLRYERYLLPAIPALAVLTGSLATPAGLAALFPRLRDSAGARRMAIAIAIVLAAFAVLRVRGLWQGLVDDGRNERVRAVGERLQEVVPADAWLVVDSPEVAFFADRHYRTFRQISTVAGVEELRKTLDDPTQPFQAIIDSGFFLSASATEEVRTALREVLTKFGRPQTVRGGGEIRVYVRNSIAPVVPAQE